jgi:NAD+ synthase (glutamine-hydrolysing)
MPLKRHVGRGADLAVFSELAVTGYPPLDLLLRSDIIDSSMAAIREIATHCNGIAAIVGGPSPNTGEYGKSLYNSAFFLQEGKINAVVNKALLPTYDIFDEDRYFKAGNTFRPVELNGRRLPSPFVKISGMNSHSATRASGACTTCGPTG